MVLSCAAVSLGCVGDRIFSDVAIGVASFAIVVAVGVARTMFAIADEFFAQPLLEDFNTLLRDFGPALMLEIIDCPFAVFDVTLPVSTRSLASKNHILCIL